MKSISHGKAGANAKLRGKRECTLSCGCCVMQNFRDGERWKEAASEIKRYPSGDDWFYDYEHVDETQVANQR